MLRLKVLTAGKLVGVQEVQQSPQLLDAVLEWRACSNSLDLRDCLGFRLRFCRQPDAVLQWRACSRSLDLKIVQDYIESFHKTRLHLLASMRSQVVYQAAQVRVSVDTLHSSHCNLMPVWRPQTGFKRKTWMLTSAAATTRWHTICREGRQYRASSFGSAALLQGKTKKTFVLWQF